jgi:glycogen synthase
MFVSKNLGSFYNYYSTPPQTLLEYAKTSCGYGSLSKEVQEILEKASHSQFIDASQKKALIIDPDYQIAHLSKKSLVQVYEIISAYHAQAGKSSPFFVHVFDIEDHIFRQVLDDPKSAGKEYEKLLAADSPLMTKIHDLMKTGSRFYKLEPKKAKASNIQDFQIARDEPRAKPHPKKPLKVLKITAENSRNFSGGIASVVMGLASAHKKLRALNPDCAKTYTLSFIYEKDKHALKNYTFQGLLTHSYEGKIVRSSVYKSKENLEYLIQPDPAFPRIFNTPTTKVVTSEGSEDRMLYMGSAAAAFASLYKGKTGDRQIQVLQCENTNIIGVAFPLLRQIFDPLKKACGLQATARTIAVWHHGNVGYGAKCPSKRLELLGIKSKKAMASQVDLIELGLPYTDKVLHVSKEAAKRALDPDPSVHKGRRSLLLGSGKVISIANGVETEKFDPTNKAVFHSLALERTFDTNGVETTDYVSYRKKLKELLYQAKIIKDPNLPLVLFVGRYVLEKGINTLADVIETFPRSAQFVCMGHGIAIEALDRLKHMERTTHQKHLKMFTAFEDQKRSFSHAGKDYGVPLGQLIRAAADFCFIPSYVEACPLIPMESLCSGGLLVTPFHQGFKEICKPQGDIYTLDTEANAVCYEDPFSSSQAKEALVKALNLIANIPDKNRNEIAARIRNHATSSYGWYHLDLRNKTLSGGAISYDRLYHDLAKRKQPGIFQKTATSETVPIVMKPSITEMSAYSK